MLKRDFALFGNNPPSLIRVELASASDHFPINDLWEEGLKPNLDWLAEPLLSSIVGHLAAQHRTLYAWQAATRERDPASFRRRAIKPHEQDKHPGTVDVLIDMARDCLEWLASHQPEIAAHWCDQLAGAEAPLLRRSAVHTLSIRKDLTPNEKIDWLLARMDLHDLSAQRELLLVLQQTYPKVNQEQRSAIIKAVLAYRRPREDEDRESLTTYNHFNWLHWLQSEASNCALAKEALDDVWKRYPDFQQRKQPDLAHWTRSGCIDHQSPWTVEELLSQPAKAWAEKLLSFQQTDSSGPDRHELERTVSEALNRKFEWGLDLANALVTDGNWDTDLWTVLIRVWSETELDENRGQEILQWLYRTELHQKHAHAVADFLYALVKDDGTQHTYKLLAQANEIAASLWCSLGHSEPLSDFDDRLIQSLGHAGDKVAQFWLGSLSCWRKQQDPKPDALSEDYRAALSDIVRDETEAGRLGRSVLAWNLSFLLEADEEWTRTNMLPLFTNHANVDDYQDIWDSFLHGFSLISSVAEFMEGAFLEAVSRIESDLWGENRYGMFIKVYTCILAYFADDPLRVWIRRFFDHAGEEARCHFASVLGDLLHNMDDTQQQEWWGRWLKHYWENRLQGTLKPFDDSNDGDEIGIMLSWLPYLKTVFPEAVDLAIRMPPVQLTDSTEGSGVVYLIYRNGLWQSYPVAVTKLLIHLGRIESRSWDGGQELIGKLLQADLTSELKQKLEELAATRGLA